MKLPAVPDVGGGGAAADASGRRRMAMPRTQRLRSPLPRKAGEAVGGGLVVVGGAAAEVSV